MNHEVDDQKHANVFVQVNWVSKSSQVILINNEPYDKLIYLAFSYEHKYEMHLFYVNKHWVTINY